MNVILEAVCSPTSRKPVEIIHGFLLQAIPKGSAHTFVSGSLLPVPRGIESDVLSIKVCEVTPMALTPGADHTINIFCYALHKEELAEEPLQQEDALFGNDDGEANLPSFTALALPNESTEGIWESLLFDADSGGSSGEIKQRLLRYATVALQLSMQGVDPNLVIWNRIILLHGPPGTGKTSLCKGLAHKLSVRFRAQYRSTELVEINAHSLFSRWFSESGKQVMLLFQRIREMVQRSETLVCILIDEVESLAAARSSAAKGNEPSDAIRVVNALLTQLDGIRRYPNVLILTTSNITGSIDVAFVDRADLKLRVGPPSLACRASILASAHEELCRQKVVAPMAAMSNVNGAAVATLSNATAVAAADDDAPVKAASSSTTTSMPPTGHSSASKASITAATNKLLERHAAHVAFDYINGRVLRKLPMLALVEAANLLGGCNNNCGPSAASCISSDTYLAGLEAALKLELQSRASLE